MNSLPTEILTYITIQLPLKSLVLFGATSKSHNAIVKFILKDGIEYNPDIFYGLQRSYSNLLYIKGIGKLYCEEVYPINEFLDYDREILDYLSKKYTVTGPAIYYHVYHGTYLREVIVYGDKESVIKTLSAWEPEVIGNSIFIGDLLIDINYSINTPDYERIYLKNSKIFVQPKALNYYTKRSIPGDNLRQYIFAYLCELSVSNNNPKIKDDALNILSKSRDRLITYFFK